jgi:hypothetical protein
MKTSHRLLPDDPPLRLLEAISWEQVKTDLRAAVSDLL